MIFFFDESGHPHPHDTTSRPVKGCIGFPIAQSRTLTAQLYALKREMLPDPSPQAESSYKAHAIFNQATFSRVGTKWAYLREAINLAIELPVVSFFIVMRQPRRPPNISEGYLSTETCYLLQRINAYMTTEKSEEKAILVFDSQDMASDEETSIAMQNFLFRHRDARNWGNIMEVPLFVDSRITPGVQIADYFVSCVRQYHEIREGCREVQLSYERAVGRLYQSIRTTVYDSEDDDGNIEYYGEYIMSQEAVDRIT